MDIKKPIFFLFLSVLLIFPPIIHAEQVNQHGVTGGVLPGNNYEAAIAIAPYIKDVNMLDQIKRIRVTIDPHMWNGSGYTTVAEPVIEQVYVSAGRGEVFTENVDYTLFAFKSAVKASSTGGGDYQLKMWEFTILNPQKFKEAYEISFNFIKYKILGKGTIRVEYNYYNDDSFNPTFSDYIDFPTDVFNNYVSPEPSRGPMSETPTPYPTVKEPVPTIYVNPTTEPVPTIDPIKLDEVNRLRTEVEKLKQEQGLIVKEVRDQRNLLEKIIDFIKSLFGIKI